MLVVGNRFAGNRVGMTLISNYREAFEPQRSNTIAGNVIAANDNAESPAQADGAFGVGIGIGGGQANLVQANTITGNAVAVAFASAEDIPAIGNTLEANDLAGNGLTVWDSSTDRAPAKDNCFAGNEGVPDGCGPFAAALPPVAPPGVPFFDIPLPSEQPGLDGDLTLIPAPLPTAPAAPPIPTTPPPPDLLAAWSRFP